MVSYGLSIVCNRLTTRNGTLLAKARFPGGDLASLTRIAQELSSLRFDTERHGYLELQIHFG